MGPSLHRTNTLSSLGGFDFEHALLPLTLSGEEAAEDGHVEHKHVGLLHGGLPMESADERHGSGRWHASWVGHLFVSGSSRCIGWKHWSQFACLVCVWAARMDRSKVRAAVGKADRSSYAELGCAIPLSGGAQAYLAYSVRVIGTR